MRLWKQSVARRRDLKSEIFSSNGFSEELVLRSLKASPYMSPFSVLSHRRPLHGKILLLNHLCSFL